MPRQYDFALLSCASIEDDALASAHFVVVCEQRKDAAGAAKHLADFRAAIAELGKRAATKARPGSRRAIKCVWCSE